MKNMYLARFSHLFRIIYGSIHYKIFKHPYIGDIWDKRLDINKKDIVLEVGSGFNPSLRSDVLCEKFISDTNERKYTAYIPKSRPFIIGDGCDLPFADNAFDYIISKHVIEHVNNPGRMLKEFQRVSRKGFVAAPCGFWESISAGSYHKWFVFVRNGRLVLEQKMKKKDRKYEGIIKYKGSSSREIKYEYNMENPLDYRIVKRDATEEFVWAEVEGINEMRVLLNGDLTASFNFDLKLRLLFKDIIRDCFFRSSTCFNIFELLACPLCKSSLRKSGDLLICQNCRYKFQIVNNIPILLKERAMAY